MGISFRKSISFGPVRVNLSSRGVSYSVGVKGARVGVNRQGTYVSLGAAGIQYRRYLPTPPAATPPYPLPQTGPVAGALHTITSEDLTQVSDVDSQDFIDELTAKAAKTAFALPGALGLAAVLVFILLSFFGQVVREEKWVVPKVEITATSGLKIREQPDKASPAVGSATRGTQLVLTDSSLHHWYGVAGGYVSKAYARVVQVPQSRSYSRLEEHPNLFWLGALLSGVLVLMAYLALARRDKERLTLEINYEFSEEMARVHQEFLQAFAQLFTSHRVWQYLHSERVTDQRRHAGASSSVTRVALGGRAPNRRPSAHLLTNVPIPYLGLRNTELFFFPERLVIKRGRAYGAVFYKNLQVAARHTQFIEEETVPSDATVVGHTWKFLNKNGTPDRRFNNNRQLPLCCYSEYTFTSATGVYEVLTTSRHGALDLFAKYTTAIGEAQQRMHIA